MLYLHYSPYEASPKAISGRTSYLRVRLAFHPYPQLIPALFNVRGFGPPFWINRTSPWPWIDHPVSGLPHATCRPLRLGFPTAPCLKHLTSLHTVTRRSVLQKVHGHTLNSAPIACRHTVSGTISLPSRGAFHLSLTVLFTIGRWIVFSLGRWSSRIPTGFHVSRGTWVLFKFSCHFRLHGFYILRLCFPAVFD